MSPELQSWEKPNGFVVRGISCALMFAFDDAGKAIDSVTEMNGKGWMDSVRNDALVLVHAVEGEDGSLVKRMASYQLGYEDRPITAAELFRRKLLFSLAERLRREYIAAAEKKMAEAEKSKA